MEFFAPRRLSCGVLILNAERELLLCHVTGHDHWDLPKGVIHAGESPLDAALRETQEETGLSLDAKDLLDLGRFDYRPRKELHLFATMQPRLDVAALACASHFTDMATGRRLPEMDGYGWFGLAEAPQRCSGKMAAVLAGKIELDRLLARLLSRREPAAAERPARRRGLAAAIALGEAG